MPMKMKLFSVFITFCIATAVNQWVEIGTETAGDGGSDKWRYLDFGSEIYGAYDEIEAYKLEWGENYGNFVVFELGDGFTNHHIFENTATSVNPNIKINILESNVAGLPVAADQYFCKACEPNQGTKPGDTCWAVLAKSDTNRGCGCNSGGWNGNGAYYGGWLPHTCNQCICWGGAFAGYKQSGAQKGTINSVGLRLSIRLAAEEANECPAPTELVAAGVYGAAPWGGPKYDLTIDECKAYCDALKGRCLSFTFDPTGYYPQRPRSICRRYRYRFAAGWYNPKDPRFADQILCAYPADVECPTGTIQVGEKGAFGDRYMGGARAYTPALCERYCRRRSGCKAFGFDPHGFNRAYCRFFRSDAARDMSRVNIRDGHRTKDQILCALGPPPPPPPEPKCPEGTKQIGGAGKTIGATSQTMYGLTIDQCNERCNRLKDPFECTAFEYDQDWGKENESRSRCKLFITRYGEMRSQLTKDQILCGVERDEPEAQMVSFGFDDLTGEVGESGVSAVGANGQALGVSVNMIYIIVGLLCLNIVCLAVHCWRNMKKDKRKYQGVAMRSDYETENDA